jgi:hypothetical protein
VRQLILVLVLVAASFLGGAFVNGPGLQWVQTRVVRSLGLNNRYQPSQRPTPCKGHSARCPLFLRKPILSNVIRQVALRASRPRGGPAPTACRRRGPRRRQFSHRQSRPGHEHWPNPLPSSQSPQTIASHRPVPCLLPHPPTHPPVQSSTPHQPLSTPWRLYCPQIPHLLIPLRRHRRRLRLLRPLPSRLPMELTTGQSSSARCRAWA